MSVMVVRAIGWLVLRAAVDPQYSDIAFRVDRDIRRRRLLSLRRETHRARTRPRAECDESGRKQRGDKFHGCIPSEADPPIPQEPPPKYAG